MIKKVVSCLFILLVTTVWAQEEVIPGLIPRFYSIEAATDLPLSPEEAHEKALAGFDLSTLDPDGSTNIWHPENHDIPQSELLQDIHSVRFIKELPSRSGQVRFTVLTNDGRELILILSKKIHSIILRRNLLAKLGYATQPMAWVGKIQVDFLNTIDRDLLKEEMKDKLLAGTERWIQSEEELSLSLQDALILTPETDIYNLALGLMPVSVHQGRRLLKAPYVPLALVDTPESVNLMPWQAGRLILNQIKLNHTQDLDISYGPSWEDARWIGRRIGKLSRLDWEEIVVKSFYPLAVEKLLIEKILARRNDMLKLLELDQEFPNLPFNPEVNLGEVLVKGEIVQEFFEGYASRFSFGDPESPFSASELGSFALSRVQSQLIDTAIGQLNQLLGSDDEGNYSDKIRAIVENEGPFFSTRGLAIPTFHGSFILSRDIVTGSYLGTNNKVQLVDNFGVSLDAGMVAGIENFPIPVGLKAGASLLFQRVFSHVKPVQSLKKSIKEPFKNLLVPFLMKQLGHKIDQLSTATGEDQALLLANVLGELKAAIGIGESFIITDSLVPDLFTEVKLSFSQFFFMDPELLKIHARVQSDKMILSRFHFYRASEHTFHVYQDYGKELKLMLTLKLKSYVPVVALNARWSKASVETKFFPLSLHPRDASVDVLKALRLSLLSLNHSGLEGVVKPHKVEHAMKEKGSTLQLLIFKRNKVGSDQSMVVSHAQGGEVKLIQRRYDALTTGMDAESYAIEAANDLISLFLKSDLGLSQMQTSNPGFTLGGKARNKIFTSEFDGKRLTTNYQRILNGWKVKPRRMKRLLKMLNQEVGMDLFDPLSVMNTDSILLYQIQYMYVITQEGVDKILNTSFNALVEVMTQYAPDLSIERKESLARMYRHDLSNIKKLLQDPSQGGLKKYHKLLRRLQDRVTIQGLAQLAGKDNIAYQGRIDGFRQGDENGDNPVFSYVLGELPIALQVSPTQEIMQSWGILEGELLVNWMMERAI